MARIMIVLSHDPKKRVHIILASYFTTILQQLLQLKNVHMEWAVVTCNCNIFAISVHGNILIIVININCN